MTPEGHAPPEGKVVPNVERRPSERPKPIPAGVAMEDGQSGFGKSLVRRILFSLPQHVLFSSWFSFKATNNSWVPTPKRTNRATRTCIRVLPMGP